METLSRKAFFRVEDWSDSTEYRMWVRGYESELLEIHFRKPNFEVDSIDGKLISVTLILQEGKPTQVKTSRGTLEVLRTEKLQGLAHGGSALKAPRALPPEWEKKAKKQLRPGETVQWWGTPGPRAKLITLAVLSGILCGVS